MERAVMVVPTYNEIENLAEVGLYDAVTPAVRIGPWLGRACVALVAVALLAALIRGMGQYRRTRRSAAVVGFQPAPTDRTLV